MKRTLACALPGWAAAGRSRNFAQAEVAVTVGVHHKSQVAQALAARRYAFLY
jgi:hypothetical protein